MKTQSFRLSRMGTAVGESATLRQAARVADLRSRGQKIANLTVGEPNCDMPQPLIEAAHRAIDEGHTRYTPTAGIPELRRKLAQYYSARHGVEWQPSQTIVSTGVKQVLWNALAVLVEPGDEVVLIAPYWVTYSAFVRLLGGVPRVVRPGPERDHKATGEELSRVLGPRTRAVLFNSPVNPTGAVYSRDEQRDLLAPLLDHDAVLLSDEIYEHMVYDVPHFSPVQVYPELAGKMLVTSGASKSYAMTGWRIGYGLGPEPLIQAMKSLQSHMTGNPGSVAQHIALAALDLEPAALRPMLDRFQRRRDVCVEALREMPDLRFPYPQGAFYVFLDVQPFFGVWEGGQRIETSEALSEHLLEKHGVAVVPGGSFDNDGGIRMSYTLSEEELRQSVGTVARALRGRI